jgi:hypothetical protein
MKSDEKIQQQIEETINSIDNIQRAIFAYKNQCQAQ